MAFVPDRFWSCCTSRCQAEHEARKEGGADDEHESVNYDNESAMLREVLRQLAELRASAKSVNDTTAHASPDGDAAARTEPSRRTRRRRKRREPQRGLVLPVHGTVLPVHGSAVRPRGGAGAGSGVSASASAASIRED